MRSWNRAGGAVATSAVLAIVRLAAPAPGVDRAKTTGKPSAPCASVQKAAAKVLAADDAFLIATTDKAQNSALDREDTAIDTLRTALRGCDALAMGSACSGLVTAAATIVASEDEFDRAQRDAAKDAALAEQDPAIAELDVRLADCKAGEVPEACAASLRSARDILRAEEQFQKAKGDRAENVALAEQDRAVAALKVRLVGCTAAPTAAACPAMLETGQRVVDAEDRFHVSTGDAETNAALDAEQAAIDDLDTAVATCTGGSAGSTSSGGSKSKSGSGSSSDDDVDLFGDSYVADLTKGHGDFVAKDLGTYASRYAKDGFHLTIASPQTWGPAGVQSGLPHSVLSASVDVDLSAAPSDAAFGPFCWHDPSHGYGFVLSTTGDAQLVRIDGSYGALEVLRSASTAPPAARVTLTVTCVRTEPSGNADVRLGAYVGDRKVLEASAPAVEDFQYTGFSGHTATTVPAGWSVAHFERRGPEDLPRDAPL